MGRATAHFFAPPPGEGPKGKISLNRAVEIPCPTCPTWSHFIQDKLKFSIYLSLTSANFVIKLIKFVFHILINYYEFTCCIENSVDPDQLASLEAS